MTQAHAAKFTTGSMMRHVVVMTATGSIGLMAVFVVDLLNLFYISLLGEQELAAAIGYAGTVLFFATSICIGVTISGVAVVAKSRSRTGTPKSALRTAPPTTRPSSPSLSSRVKTACVRRSVSHEAPARLVGTVPIAQAYRSWPGTMRPCSSIRAGS